MMATKSSSKSGGKRMSKMSASAARAEGAARADRLRKSVLKEITDRIAKGEKADAAPSATKSDAPLHEGTITRADGEVVKVTVPANHSEQGGPTEATPKAPNPKKPRGTKGEKRKAEKAPKPPKPAKAKKPKRISALDAAAIVLADTKKSMRAIDLIAEIQTRGLWSSPKGKTPEASLYAAMIREISARGKDARFAKHDRGLFITNTPTSAKTNAPASA